MNTRAMEHRWGDRVPVDIPVRMVGPARTVMAGRLTSFSVSGAFIATSADVPVMTNITLVMHSGERNSIRPHPIAGYVVRQTRDGIALGWWKLAPVTVVHVVSIDAVLRSRGNSAPPTLVCG